LNLKLFEIKNPKKLAFISIFLVKTEFKISKYFILENSCKFEGLFKLKKNEHASSALFQVPRQKFTAKGMLPTFIPSSKTCCKLLISYFGSLASLFGFSAPVLGSLYAT
jgi:hypothetical protein